VVAGGKELAPGARGMWARTSLSALFDHAPQGADYREIQTTNMGICSQSVPFLALLHPLPDGTFEG